MTVGSLPFYRCGKELRRSDVPVTYHIQAKPGGAPWRSVSGLPTPEIRALPARGQDGLTEETGGSLQSEDPGLNQSEGTRGWTTTRARVSDSMGNGS